jgi:hypothetical protein
LSIKLDYYIKYYSGRLSTYKLDRTIITVEAPRILAMSTSPASVGASLLRLCGCRLFCNNGSRCSALLFSFGHHLFSSRGCGLRAPLRSRGLALQLRQELFNSGGWATTPSGLPHRVPLAFVALISGLRRRHLLQARKLSRQQVNSRD